MVARQGGLNVFRALCAHPEIEVVALYTHSRKASFEDPARPERPEFPEFVAEAKAWDVPLHIVDFSRDGRKMPGFAELGAFHFLLCLSWRYLIPREVLDRPTVAPVNLHRGKLPKYGGNFPLQRALEDGVREATITAHVMQEEIDTGEILAELDRPMELREGEAILDAVERIKKELEPFYPGVAVASLNRILEREGAPRISREGTSV